MHCCSWIPALEQEHAARKGAGTERNPEPPTGGVTTAPRICSYCGAGTEMESFLGHADCDGTECPLCDILKTFAAEEKLIPEKMVLCRYCLADFLMGTPHDQIVYPCDGAAPTLHSVRLTQMAAKRGA